MLSNLKNEINFAAKNKFAIAGFNVFGVEDSLAVVKAAEEMNVPTLFMINKLAVEYMPVENWAGMLLPIAENAKIPVSLHLDHCKDYETVIRAIKAGFTSVMYDGSQLSVEENIKNTNDIARVAKIFNVSVEGEIGSVPYADIPGHAKDIITLPEELKTYAQESHADWIAIAIGQIHRLQGEKSNINFEQFDRLKTTTSKPLIIHGGTGIKEEDLHKLCSENIGKVNFGTSLRVAFGEALRIEVAQNKKEFDRLKLFKVPADAVKQAAIQSIKSVTKGR